MATFPLHRDLYNRLIIINAEAFQATLFVIAYYALITALHCAKEMEEYVPLCSISKTALDQLAVIDLKTVNIRIQREMLIDVARIISF
jgi:hypothetical protein